LARELFARGNAAFVEELRRVHDPERLGDFAATWVDDPRPFARQALLDYLSRPLNCYRHEPLVKRLFKLAETKADDELMGAFLVALDRAVRRVRKKIIRHKHGQFPNRAAAEDAVRQWEREGFTGTFNDWGNRAYAYGSRSEEAVILPSNTSMPRPSNLKRNEHVNDRQRAQLEKRFQLFSLPTRRYLRRRAWRYFRVRAKADPARYVRAAGRFLPRYTDADVDSDIHLLDNWGLVHALFHNSPALERPVKGWQFAEGRSLAVLGFAPYREAAWVANPEAVFALLLAANCRPVRSFALWLLRTRQADWLAARPVATLLQLADHADPDVAELGFDLLERAADLSAVPVGEWLARLEGDDLNKLQRLSDLLTRRLDPARVSPADAIRLAGYRSRPVAALGFEVLKQKAWSATDATALLPLTQAECESVRPELMRWLRDTLTGFGPVRSEWVLEFLDSKHADARQAGWEWLRAAPPEDAPRLWHKLMESPYDDVRGPLVAHLSEVAAGADVDTVRLLWATVLLNIHRGGRYKPGVVAQVVDRIERHSNEIDTLLPLLAVAVRSLRGPEFRAGLAGVVALGETRPELRPLIQKQFPELEMS
jgi:hypothetical protein